MSLLEVTGLTRSFGGVTAADQLDLTIAPGETVSVIGLNGAGKITLFNLITGLDRPDAGAITLDDRSITGIGPEQVAALGLARTFQHGRVFANLSVLDNVLVGAHTRLRAVRPLVPLLGPLAELAVSVARYQVLLGDGAAITQPTVIAGLGICVAAIGLGATRSPWQQL